MEELQKVAQKEDWNQLWVILVAHCINRLINRYGIKGNKDELLKISEEKLSEVLSLVLVEGTRNWNTDGYKTFKDFLVSVIDSYLNNSFNKSKSKEEPTEEIINSSEDGSPEDIMIYEELRQEAYAFLETEGSSDEELMIFECMADGVVKPKAIREDLGISESDFHNAWRRLKPRLNKLRQKLLTNE
ncbi:hypothetical protein [Algoriphagus faecimaris]|nr:hypothetical protein [Algoriphagus faecimaris]